MTTEPCRGNDATRRVRWARHPREMSRGSGATSRRFRCWADARGVPSSSYADAPGAGRAEAVLIGGSSRGGRGPGAPAAGLTGRSRPIRSLPATLRATRTLLQDRRSRPHPDPRRIGPTPADGRRSRSRWSSPCPWRPRRRPGHYLGHARLGGKSLGVSLPSFWPGSLILLSRRRSTSRPRPSEYGHEAIWAPGSATASDPALDVQMASFMRFTRRAARGAPSGLLRIAQAKASPPARSSAARLRNALIGGHRRRPLSPPSSGRTDGDRVRLAGNRAPGRRRGLQRTTR
jgi:hypothetical protein